MEDLTSNGGERLCTLMVYLTSPEDGGNTVFPQLGLSVTPEVETRNRTEIILTNILSIIRKEQLSSGLTSRLMESSIPDPVI